MPGTGGTVGTISSAYKTISLKKVEFWIIFFLWSVFFDYNYKILFRFFDYKIIFSLNQSWKHAVEKHWGRKVDREVAKYRKKVTDCEPLIQKIPLQEKLSLHIERFSFPFI